jgi:protoporphyrinogen/coproporphyrinogen III oxidase
MNSVAVIGAGITGLTAAFYLKRAGVPVTVYEASGRVGGVIQSERREGYLIEGGPNTILGKSPKLRQLVEDAGLESRRIETDPKAEARYLVRDKRPIAMPASAAEIVTSELLTAKAKLVLMREPFVPPRRDGKEESLAEFTVRRLSQEFLDYGVDPLVAGIYAGDPYKLSVQHAFPKLAEAEQQHGSLIKAERFSARERKERGDAAKERTAKFSFDEGLQVLTDTLRDRLGEAVKLNAVALKAGQTPSGWALELNAERGTVRAEHSAVIYCGTAFRLAEFQVEVGAPASGPAPERRSALQCDGGRLDLSPFAEIRYSPVATAMLGFRREDVEHPCSGFGMLIPKVEGFKILGTIFSSSLFPDRAPAGHLLLTTFVGGERYPELAHLAPEKLFELVCEDLRVLLGVKGKPAFAHSVLYPKAIPQYNVGYGRYRDLMTDLENQAPGLFLAGHYRDGVSLSDSIVSGADAAERVEKFLK